MNENSKKWGAKAQELRLRLICRMIISLGK